jgi:DNA-directed RNA polymerase subunit RPC12/RpoP
MTASNHRFRNFYCCPRCGHEWWDDWSATSDDDCPSCGARHISPNRSEDINIQDSANPNRSADD